MGIFELMMKYFSSGDDIVEFAFMCAVVVVVDFTVLDKYIFLDFLLDIRLSIPKS